MTTKSMDAIMALCKRRGFIYQASEIYGGINGFWDYGPLGAQMKKNLREAWWQDMIMRPAWGRPGPGGKSVRCVPVETRIIQHPKVWEASGHVGGFNDPRVDDKETKQRFRADHLQGVYIVDRVLDGAELAAAQYSGKVFVERIPDFTIVANGADEAVSILAGDKKLQKLFGIRELGTFPKPIENVAPLIAFQYQGKLCVAMVYPVSQHVLKSAPDKVPSPFTGKAGHLTEPRQFSLMFHTYVGATASEDDKA